MAVELSAHTIPDTAIIVTDKWYLRPYLMTDAESMAAKANDADIARYMRNTFPAPYKLDDAVRFLSIVTVDSPITHFGIFVPDGRYAGSMALMPKKDIDHRNWEIGYWVAKEFWGQGLVTSVLKQFPQWCFEAFPQLLRIEACVFSGNSASARALERAGFIKEGVRRQAIEKHGVVYDQIIYSLLRSDIEK